MHSSVQFVDAAGRAYGQGCDWPLPRSDAGRVSYLAIAVDRLVIRDDIVRAQPVYYYNHNESGRNLDGRLRHAWQVAEGKVVRIDEYHDVALLKSFLDMVAGLRKT